MATRTATHCSGSERGARIATSRHDELHQKVGEFHKKHPEVWIYFERFTLELIAAGRTHYGAKGVMERVRWETALGGGEGLKINNNYTAFYARRFERLHPQHEGFFEKREQKSRVARARGVTDWQRFHDQAASA